MSRESTVLPKGFLERAKERLGLRTRGVPCKDPKNRSATDIREVIIVCRNANNFNLANDRLSSLGIDVLFCATAKDIVQFFFTKPEPDDVAPRMFIIDNDIPLGYPPSPEDLMVIDDNVSTYKMGVGELLYKYFRAFDKDVAIILHSESLSGNLTIGLPGDNLLLVRNSIQVTTPNNLEADIALINTRV